MFKKLNFPILFTVLLFIILALLTFSPWASKYNWDISHNKLASLSESSIQMLTSIQEPLSIIVYSPDIDLLNVSNDLLKQYKKHSNHINIETHQTVFQPSGSDKLQVTSNHNLIVKYKNLTRAIDINSFNLSEQNISNLIQKIINDNNKWLVFLSGHQEIDPYSKSLLGLSNFTDSLKKQGVHISSLNLAKQKHIPDNAEAIIIVNPKNDLLSSEKKLLQEYLSAGKKIIWFTEPDSVATSFLTEEFGVKLSKGVVIDMASLNLGSPHPAIKIITHYPAHPIVSSLKNAIILPWSGNLNFTPTHNNWQIQPFITTNNTTWTYDVATNTKQQFGPLNIGLTLSKSNSKSIIIADSSFITNKYINLYANQDFTSNILTWLNEDNAALTFMHQTARDLSYTPNNFNILLYRYGFTLLLPFLIVLCGLYLKPR